MKINFLTNSHIISNRNTFSTIFGMRDQYLSLFLQFDVNNKVKNHGVNVLEQF